MTDTIATARTYLVLNNMREVAAALDVSVWTVHRRLNVELPRVDADLHEQVRKRIEHNRTDRARRGGHATFGGQVVRGGG